MNESAWAVVLILAAVLPGLSLLILLNSAEIRLRGGVRLRFGRPWGPVILAFAVGVVAAWPAYWIEVGLDHDPWRMTNLGAMFLFWLIVAGLTEECCKFAMFHLGPALTRWYREEYDGILFAAAVGLGFATIENLFYVRDMGMEAARVRAFTAVPAHAMLGVLLGSYLGMARARARLGWSSMGLPLAGLLLAIFLHGAYDLLACLAALGSGPAWIGLLLLFGGMLLASVRCALQARGRSPAFGGRRLAVPPPLGAVRLPPMPVPRNPGLAAALGLVPGLGQAYNGEDFKAAVFLFIGSVNLALYWVAHLFVSDPSAAINLLRSLHVTVAADPAQLEQAVRQKWLVEPCLLYLVLLWELVGAWDAWATARRRWSRPQTHAVRRSFACHGFGTSYVMHLVVILLLVIAPVADVVLSGATASAVEKTSDSGTESAEEGARGDRHDWQLTWVQAPTRIDGWQSRPEGPSSAPDNKPGEAVRVPSSPDEGEMRVGSRGLPGGVRGSYDQYLSYQIRRHHADMYFFRHVARTTWAVVHYRIGADGGLRGVELMKHGGPLEEARRAVVVVERAAPFQPLPQGARELDVVELFWNTAQGLEPGTLEWKLSRLPDGRRVRATP
jgi:RsiW-degrading membrane proteinase PrsW (M82 family)